MTTRHVMNVDQRNLHLVPLLHPPVPDGEPVSAVLDTDTYNEIDDQFALAYALLSPQRIRLEACYAAPFHNARSTGPADGMERSYEEILRVLKLLDVPADGFAFRGSTDWLPGPDEPVRSEAVDDLIQRAMVDRDGPLYVMAIGAITNVASAILIEPAIRDRIVVVWLSGQPHDWRTAREFNLQQDIHASRVIFDSGVPVVHVPCTNVAEHVDTSGPEIAHHLQDAGPLGGYLNDIFQQHLQQHGRLSKKLWDITTVAWLIDPAWLPTVLVPSPILTDQLTWSHDPRRHLVRVAHHVQRDAIFRDLFEKVRGRGKC